ncbi:MAG TPA: hypothetical protein VGF85_02835 [Opitutaceae bacterium]|jgi:hypothetical protein
MNTIYKTQRSFGRAAAIVAGACITALGPDLGAQISTQNGYTVETSLPAPVISSSVAQNSVFTSSTAFGLITSADGNEMASVTGGIVNGQLDPSVSAEINEGFGS